MLYERLTINHSMKIQAVEFQNRVALKESKRTDLKSENRSWILPIFAWIAHWF